MRAWWKPRVGWKQSPHPEERPQGASRRMGRKPKPSFVIEGKRLVLTPARQNRRSHHLRPRQRRDLRGHFRPGHRRIAGKGAAKALVERRKFMRFVHLPQWFFLPHFCMMRDV